MTQASLFDVPALAARPRPQAMTLPYAPGSETSQAAAIDAVARAPTQREKVFLFI